MEEYAIRMGKLINVIKVVQGIYIAAIWMVENNEYITDY